MNIISNEFVVILNLIILTLVIFISLRGSSDLKTISTWISQVRTDVTDLEDRIIKLDMLVANAFKLFSSDLHREISNTNSSLTHRLQDLDTKISFIEKAFIDKSIEQLKEEAKPDFGEEDIEITEEDLNEFEEFYSPEVEKEEIKEEEEEEEDKPRDLPKLKLLLKPKG